jgi:hypothetical protein
MQEMGSRILIPKDIGLAHMSGSRIERAFVSSEFGTTRTPRIKLACKVKPLGLG